MTLEISKIIASLELSDEFLTLYVDLAEQPYAVANTYDNKSEGRTIHVNKACIGTKGETVIADRASLDAVRLCEECHAEITILTHAIDVDITIELNAALCNIAECSAELLEANSFRSVWSNFAAVTNEIKLLEEYQAVKDLTVFNDIRDALLNYANERYAWPQPSANNYSMVFLSRLCPLPPTEHVIFDGVQFSALVNDEHLWLSKIPPFSKVVSLGELVDANSFWTTLINLMDSDADADVIERLSVVLSVEN